MLHFSKQLKKHHEDWSGGGHWPTSRARVRERKGSLTGNLNCRPRTKLINSLAVVLVRRLFPLKVSVLNIPVFRIYSTLSRHLNCRSCSVIASIELNYLCIKGTSSFMFYSAILSTFGFAPCGRIDSVSVNMYC